MAEFCLNNPYGIIGVFALAISLLVMMRPLLKGKDNSRAVQHDSGSISASLLHNKQPAAGIQKADAQIKGKRKEQEDACGSVENGNGVLAVVADGMGGYANGQKSSALVVDTFLTSFARPAAITSFERFFKETVRSCYNRMLREIKNEKSGSTVAAVVIARDTLHWVSMGDSAIILSRDGESMTLNKKHVYQSVLEKEYHSGKISKQTLMTHPKKNRLTSFIGKDGFREIEISREGVALQSGDKVMVCSDGVYNSISAADLDAFLSKKAPVSSVVRDILASIEHKNISHQDNATVILLEKS